MPNHVPALRVQICEEISQVESVIETKCILCIENPHGNLCGGGSGLCGDAPRSSIEVGDKAKGGLNPGLLYLSRTSIVNGSLSGVLVRSRCLQ